MYVGAASFVFGFAIIWHIWWLALVALVVAVLLVIYRTLQEDTERTITASEVAATEARLWKGAAL